jgi:hypothetical protein
MQNPRAAPRGLGEQCRFLSGFWMNAVREAVMIEIVNTISFDAHIRVSVRRGIKS